MTEITQDDVSLAAPQPKTQNSRTRNFRRAAGIALALLLALLLFLAYIGVFGGNVHVVQEGRVYRSAQLTGVGIQSESARLAGHGLADVLEKYHIRTVINLRVKSEDANWYFAETAISRSHNAAHIDIPLSAVRMPPPESLRELLAAFDSAPYPIIYHCQAGADRTGLVSAIYAAIYEKEPLDEAESSQLTWKRGHFSWSKTHPMDDFFDLYRKTGNGLPLREWILTKYPALYDALPADLKKPASDMAAPSNPAPKGP